MVNRFAKVTLLLFISLFCGLIGAQGSQSATETVSMSGAQAGLSQNDLEFDHDEDEGLDQKVSIEMTRGN